MTHYQAAIFHEDGSITCEHIARRPLAPHEARLRVLMAGICSTDLALQQRLLPTRIPRTFGHEFVGQVIEVGDSRQSSWIGQRVCADINFACPDERPEQRCHFCQAGNTHHCLRRVVLGIDGADGAFAEEAIVPLANLLSVPESVSDQQAVFTEPLAAALHAFTATTVRPYKIIVVLGAGRLGALIACAAQQLGGHVFAVTRTDHKQGRLRELGLQHLYTADEPRLEHELLAASGGLLADIVVEVTGSPHGLSQALRWVRPQGKIVLKSTCGLPAELDQTHLVVQEIQLIGSRCGDYHAAMEWLGAQRVPVDVLVEQTFPLHEISAAMSAARHQLKVMLQIAGS